MFDGEIARNTFVAIERFSVQPLTVLFGSATMKAAHTGAAAPKMRREEGSGIGRGFGMGIDGHVEREFSLDGCVSIRLALYLSPSPSPSPRGNPGPRGNRGPRGEPPDPEGNSKT